MYNAGAYHKSQFCVFDAVSQRHLQVTGEAASVLRGVHVVSGPVAVVRLAKVREGTGEAAGDHRSMEREIVRVPCCAVPCRAVCCVERACTSQPVCFVTYASPRGKPSGRAVQLVTPPPAADW